MSLLRTGCCSDPIVLMSCQDTGAPLWSTMRCWSSNSRTASLLRVSLWQVQQIQSRPPGFVGFLGVSCSPLHPGTAAERSDAFESGREFCHSHSPWGLEGSGRMSQGISFTLESLSSFIATGTSTEKLCKQNGTIILCVLLTFYFVSHITSGTEESLLIFCFRHP